MSWAIKKGDTFLDLSEKGKITLRFVNNLFQNRTLLNDFSLPVDIPSSNKNLVALGLTHLANIKLTDNEYDVVLYAGAVPYSKAKLVLRGYSNKFTANLNFGIATLSCFETKLPELDLGGDRPIGDNSEDCFAHADSVVSDVYPDVDYNFPTFRNDGFMSSIPPDGMYFNAWDSSGNKFIRTLQGSLGGNALSPWVYMAYVIARGFLYSGYKASGSFFDWLVNKQLMLMGNTEWDDRPVDPNGMHATSTGDQTNAGTGTPPTPLILLMDNERLPNYDSADAYDPTTGYYKVQAAGTYDITIHVPFTMSANYAMTDMLLEVKLNGTVIYTDTQTYTLPTPLGPHEFTWNTSQVFSSSDIGKDLWIELSWFTYGAGTATIPGTVHAEAYLDIKDQAWQAANPNSIKLNLQNHVPNVSFGDLMVALESFNYMAIYNHSLKTVELRMINDLFSDANTEMDISLAGELSFDFDQDRYKDFNYNSPSDDSLSEMFALDYLSSRYKGEFDTYDDLPTVDQDGFYAYVNQAHKIVQSIAGKWADYSDAYYPYVANASGEEQRFGLCPVFMTKDKSIPSGTLDALIPIANIAGRSAKYNAEADWTGIRIAFWYGLQDTSTATRKYPMAGVTEYDLAGNVIGTHSLIWEGDKGLIKNFWEQWIAVKENRRTYKQDFRISYPDLHNWSVARKLRFRGCTWMVRESDIQIDAQLGLMKCKLIRLS